MAQLFSEDVNHGQTIVAVKVYSPLLSWSEVLSQSIFRPGGSRRGKAHPLFSCWVVKTDLPSMQTQWRVVERQGGGCWVDGLSMIGEIQRVTAHRPTQVLKVQANLVGATGEGLCLKQCCTVWESPQHGKLRGGR